MKRWGKDWSSYRTVKEVPIVFGTKQVERFKNGNDWKEYTSHTLPDKATLKRNVERVKSSDVDVEGEEYDAFGASYEHEKLAGIHEVSKTLEAQTAGKLARARAEPSIATHRAALEKHTATTAELAKDVKAAEKIAATAVARVAGRKPYSKELTEKLAALRAEGDREGWSKEDVKRESIKLKHMYNEKKEEARREVIAKAHKVPVTTAAAAAAPSVGGGGSAAAAATLPAVAAVVAKEEGVTKEELKVIVKAASKIEAGDIYKTSAEVKSMNDTQIRNYAKELRIAGYTTLDTETLRTIIMALTDSAELVEEES